MQDSETKTTDSVGIAVKNRDIAVLQGVIGTMQLIRSYEERREWQRERRFNITSHLSFSHGGGGGKGMDDVLERLDELESEQREAVRNYAAEIRHAQRIVDAITSRTMRAFVVLMYVEKLPGTRVMAELNMTRREFERARNAVEQAENMRCVRWHDKFFTENGG